MKELHAEVAVVGGGPAGSTASTVLAKAGHDVVLLEHGHHPRHQIGESLLPSTIHGIARLLGIWDEIQNAGFVRKRGGTFRWGKDPEPWTFSFEIPALGSANYAFQVERARFDAILLENARRHGVDVREGLDVVDMKHDGGRATALVARDAAGDLVQIRAEYIVDASGHGSRLARSVGSRVYSEFFRNVAVYGYYEGASRLPAPNSGNIITSAFDEGWCWFIPLSDELTSVGAVIDHRHAGRIRDGREEALVSFVRECPLVRDHLAGAERVTDGLYGKVRVRRDWSYSTERFAAPGILLAGDAACFVDPVWSSGVHLATYGGLLAARTINTIMSGEIDEATCIREFERRYKREFALWYDFVLVIYDMGQDWDSYYWSARSLLGTSERANDAFIRLVSGGGTAPADFFAEREGSGATYSKLVGPRAGDQEITPELVDELNARGAPRLVRLTNERDREELGLLGLGGAEAPLFDDGLVPSPDGIEWRIPAANGRGAA